MTHSYLEKLENQRNPKPKSGWEMFRDYLNANPMERDFTLNLLKQTQGEQ